MLREEEKDKLSSLSYKTFSRSVSWTDRPPRKSNSNPQWNSKARACLPPLSIARPTIEEWPKAGSDDLGIWPNPPTPGAKSKTPREKSTGLPEFECRKDKLAFFDKECSRILDHIYLGSDVIAKNREILNQRGITHVLNCVGFVCPEYFKNELVYKTLWLQDSPSEDITSILYDVFDYFEEVREQNGRVLVHCCHGVSRSTSLVIAYLMWKEGLTFDDAFQLVKSARGVTNPNVGFACQLLQCQKRVHSLPASPTSIIRMYRMAPHSPYDPLHLVPKMLCEAGVDKLDSRGAFIVNIPSALYIWIGKKCSDVMADDARKSASQIVRYERAKGQIIIVVEGEETFEFLNAFAHRVKSENEKGLNGRKINEYDRDFEIFDRAISGGVVPACTTSEAGLDTRLPSRENGWNRLRRKCSNLKEFTTLSNKPETLDSLESPSLNLVDSFSSFFVSKPKCDSASLSISPSTSDSSSSFTFSPSSSNCSDSSFVSSQPSPSDGNPSKSGRVDECLNSVVEDALLHDNPTSHRSRAAGLRSSSGQSLPSIDEESHVSESLPRFLEDDFDGRNRKSNGSYSPMIRDECKYEDNRVHLATVGEKSFNKDGEIKIVKEGEEPVQLSDRDSRIEIE